MDALLKILFIALVFLGFVYLGFSGRKVAPSKPKKAKAWKQGDIVTIQNPDGDKFEVLVTKEIKKQEKIKTDFLGRPVR